MFCLLVPAWRHRLESLSLIWGVPVWRWGWWWAGLRAFGGQGAAEEWLCIVSRSGRENESWAEMSGMREFVGLLQILSGRYCGRFDRDLTPALLLTTRPSTGQGRRSALQTPLPCSAGTSVIRYCHRGSLTKFTSFHSGPQQSLGFRFLFMKRDVSTLPSVTELFLKIEV